MTHYVLDTDQMTLWQRSHPVVTQRIKAVGQGNVGITIITVEEQVRGWFAEVRKASQSFQAARLSWAYEGLRDAVQSFDLQILNFTEVAIVALLSCVVRAFGLGRRIYGLRLLRWSITRF